MTLGIVLLAHGSRDPLWREPVEAVAARIREQAPQATHVCVRCAYIELAEPDLPTAAQQLLAEGATHLRVVPLFLGMGRHVREDLPRLIAALQAQHPAVPIDLRPAVGQHPTVVDVLAGVALEADQHGALA